MSDQHACLWGRGGCCGRLLHSTESPTHVPCGATGEVGCSIPALDPQPECDPLSSVHAVLVEGAGMGVAAPFGGVSGPLWNKMLTAPLKERIARTQGSRRD